MKHILLSLVATLAAASASASHLVILTDQPSGAKAREIKQLIETTLPFRALSRNELSITVEILDSRRTPVECHTLHVKYTKAEIRSLEYWAKKQGMTLTKEDLRKFRDGYDIPRSIECDRSELARIGAGYQADHALFVHDNPYEGGSGGDIPVILSGSREGIGLHEWLHTFGLADEYQYAKNEAAMFCQRRDWTNVAIFNDEPPYYGNDDVRTRHRDQIPWLPYLSRDATLVTGTNLGSPVAGNLGIFRSKTCDNTVPLLKSWKPSFHPTIMEDPYSTYIPKPYWPAILSGLGLSRARIDQLLQTTVSPTWVPTRELSPLQVSTNVLAGIESGLIRTPEDLLRSFANVYEVAEQELRDFVREITGESS